MNMYVSYTAVRFDSSGSTTHARFLQTDARLRMGIRAGPMNAKFFRSLAPYWRRCGHVQCMGRDMSSRPPAMMCARARLVLSSSPSIIIWLMSRCACGRWSGGARLRKPAVGRTLRRRKRDNLAAVRDERRARAVQVGQDARAVAAVRDAPATLFPLQFKRIEQHIEPVSLDATRELLKTVPAG